MKFLLAVVFLFSLSAKANVIGHDVQNFNPLTSGLDFITVHSSETLRPCTINCGAFINFSKNSLPNFPIDLNNGESQHSDTLVSSDLNVGIGLMRRWDLGFSVSNVHLQSVESDIQGIEYEAKGLTDFRLNTKVRFYGDYEGGLAVILGGAWNLTKNNPFTGSDNGPTINLQLAGDMILDNQIGLAANIGYRIKSNGDPVSSENLCPGGGSLCPVPEDIPPFGNTYIASVAANYFFEDWNTKLIGEIYGSLPAEDVSADSTDREQTTFEALLGLKKDFTDRFSGHLGGGFGILKGSASPDFRLYSGLNYVIGPLSFCKSDKKPVVAKINEGQNPAEAIMVAEDTTPEPIAEPEPVEDEEVFVIRDVLFDTNKHRLRPEADTTIRHVAGILKRKGGFKHVTVEGHTDSRMSHKYNQSLSERRARSVMKHLIKLGVPSDKISFVGKGEVTPIANNGNAQGRALNRRVEFRVRWR